MASVVYRFSIAAAVLAGWCIASGQSLRLTRAQHLPVFGQGLLTFSIQYSLVYAAEEHVPSAVVAVIFAGLAFVNLVLFRLLLGHRAAWQVWLGAPKMVRPVAERVVPPGSEKMTAPFVPKGFAVTELGPTVTV